MSSALRGPRSSWPAGTDTLAVIFTGAVEVGLTVVPGVSAQVALAIPELHETVTL
jgi:hypothetical protein